MLMASTCFPQFSSNSTHFDIRGWLKRKATQIYQSQGHSQEQGIGFAFQKNKIICHTWGMSIFKT